MGVDCLKPVTGRYLTHCNGKNVPEIPWVSQAEYRRRLPSSGAS